MTLTAVPSEGCSFDKWYGEIGDSEANSSTISVVMDTDRTIVAAFQGCSGLLDITVNSSMYIYGSNTINASFGSFTWSATGTIEGTRVNISAEATAGYRFDRWLGAVNGTQGTFSFFATSSEPITARFSAASSSAPWPWALLGIAIVLVIGILMYKLMLGKKKGPQNATPDAASSPQQPPTPPPGE